MEFDVFGFLGLQAKNKHTCDNGINFAEDNKKGNNATGFGASFGRNYLSRNNTKLNENNNNNVATEKPTEQGNTFLLLVY